MYLKTKVLKINGQPLKICQVSGLAHFEYLDAIADYKMPEYPLKKELEELSEEEQPAALEALNRHNRQIGLIVFKGHAMLVASSFRSLKENRGKSLEEIHQDILLRFSEQDMRTLHDEIAELSGMTLVEVSESDDTQEKEEATDPKSS